MDIASNYGERLKARSAAVQVLEEQASRISLARIVVAVGALALVPAIVWVPLPEDAWWGFLALVGVFFALVAIHGRIFAQKEKALAAQRFYERALGRHLGQWKVHASDGAAFNDAKHRYTGDLDIFGRASLFQLLDVSETTFGERRLAALLSGEATGAFPEDVRARQEAVRELASLLDFREALSVAGAGTERLDPTNFLRWLEDTSKAPSQPASASDDAATLGPGWRIASFLLPAVTIAVAVLAPSLGFERSLAFGPFLLEFFLLRALAPRTEPACAAAASGERSFVAYATMLALVESQPFKAPLLQDIQNRLRSNQGGAATVEMAALSRIVGFLEARNNELFRIVVGPLLMWDLHCAFALLAWRQRTGSSARRWLESLGEVEALAAFGAFSMENPAFAFPELATAPCYVATGLGHPLLGHSRVTNDVRLAGPGTALVVTGSNMSGKSTLLRSLGINAVLAQAGAPVCAQSMVLGPGAIATSMRIRDSLEHGISHFYAEVQKLKGVVDRARQETVLFLLDEILHGTNSRERLIGARAVLRELLRCGALGGVSTHDLALGDLEQELPEKVANVHFQEQVQGDRMTFDYRLRQGVVTSSNALRLMRMVGIDVVPLQADEP